MSGRLPLVVGAAVGALVLCVIALRGDRVGADESPVVPARPGEVLRLTLREAGKTQVLGSWTREELLGLKQTRTREKDPTSGKEALWQGVSVTDLINPVLAKFSAVDSAKVDLLVFKNDKGARSVLPRSFVNKYPIVLAVKEDSREVQGHGAVYSVVSKADSHAVRDEQLPVESYFVAGLSEIELGNYRQQFPSAFLKNRSDPKRMRGERLFVKTCMGCHAAPQWPLADKASRKILGAFGQVPATHAKLQGVPSFSQKDQIGLESYFKAVQGENPDLASGTSPSKDSG